jgi:fido (protein-threonine AMPylation protein)
MQDEAYIIQGEPDYKQRSYNWKSAIGLQQVDGLSVSRYLIDTANENIEGKISIAEARDRIQSYYDNKPAETKDERLIEEADIVSAHIAELLSERAFTLSRAELTSIHKHLFKGLYDFAGKIRDYNISKEEWVLDGESVLYASAYSITETLDYDIGQEKAFQYADLNRHEIVSHIAKFISGLWQIHAFGEGNTRTIAVFTIKYLRTFGFEVTNDTFEKHSWYFRNALVRANFNNAEKGVYATSEYLMKFFGNLLLEETNELKNRELSIMKPDSPDA